MNFNPSIPLSWVYAFSILIILILGVQLFWVINAKIPTKRKWTKMVLNILFGICFLVYLFQPNWSSSSALEPVLLYSKEVSQERVNYLKDSLGLRRAMEIGDYVGKGNPVYLLGKDYSNEELNKLVGKKVNWIRYVRMNEFEHLQWKGILNQGEIQKLSGTIHLDQPSLIELKMFDQRIAFDSLEAGVNTIELDFPVYVSGRNEMGLFLNDSLSEEIRFFAQHRPPNSFSLQFSFPDPEVRALNQYLSKKGAKVEAQIKVSRSSEIASGTKELDSLKIVIGDMTQLISQNRMAEKNEGVAGFLLINSQDPEVEVKELNELYKTDFSISRSTSEEFRVLDSGMEALPYSFVPKSGQQTLFGNAVAIQDLGGLKIGISLLNQTFPYYLSGDTLTYAQIWDEILSLVNPDEVENWSHHAPVFTNQIAEIKYNGINIEAQSTIINRDTVFFEQDLINPLTKRANFISLDSGWVSVADSMEVYVYGSKDLQSIRSKMSLANFFRDWEGDQADLKSGEEKSGIPGWVFLTLFLTMLGLLWLEPRVNY